MAEKRRGNRWRVLVELTFDVLPDEADYPDEEEPHVARRALARVKPALETVLHDRHAENEVRARKFAHYHIMEDPTRCVEFD